MSKTQPCANIQFGTIGSKIQLPVKWISIITNEIIGLSRQEQGLAQW